MLRRPTRGPARGSQRGNRGRPDSLSIGTSVFTLGDSYTEGLEGNTGGWRARMQSPGVTWRGPYTDPVGLKHAGVGGDELNPDMNGRFVADWTGNQATEIWIEGGTNDIISGGASTAALCATELDTLITAIYAAVPSTQIVRVFSIPPTDTGSDATIANYWRFNMASIVSKHRALGRRCYMHHSGGKITVAGLSPGVVKHPTDSLYGVDGYGLWALANDEIPCAWVSGARVTAATAKAPNQLSKNLSVDFNAEVGYVAGTGVWTNQGSIGGTASPTGAPKPTVVTGALGKTALRFAASPLRTGTGWALAQPNTVAIIASGITTTGSPALVDGATVGARHLMQIQATTGIFTNFAGTGVNDTVLNSAEVGHAFMTVFKSTGGDPSLSRFYVDGNPRAITMNLNTHSLDGFTIGGSAAATPSNTLNTGDIYRILVWDDELTEADIRDFHLWAAFTYGIFPVFGLTTSW